MPNEDIITALRNAVDHGDSLDSAKQVMINSGYNPKEVEEASHFLGSGVISTQQQKPQEALTMPTQKKPIKSMMSKLKFWGKKKVSNAQAVPTQPTQQVPQTSVQQPTPIQQTTPTQQIPQLSLRNSPTQKQLQKIAPIKPGHKKEITLLIVLLALIGILITVLVLKNTILSWFS
jgi:hypothetical protein